MTTSPLLEGLAFPEAPRWHGGRLWFSDFFARQVLSVQADGHGLRREAEVPQQPSGLGWAPDGTLRVVSMLDRRLLAQRANGSLRVLADLSAFAPGPCNDMVVDAAGRAWVGHFGFDLYARQPPQPATLLCVDPDGRVQVAAEGLRFPNGMAITPDGGTLIVAETMGQRVSAWRIAADGTLQERREWAALPGVHPDGLCLDAEGCVWLADARGARVLRVREGGAVLQTVGTGAHRSYACMLGGDDGCTLFVCTAPGISAEAGARREGRIEAVRVAVPHAGRP